MNRQTQCDSGIVENRIPKKQTGFTLLELMIVVAVMGILAAATAPAALRWLNQQSLQSAVYQLSSDLFKAKSLAIRENNFCDVSFFTDTNQYTLSIGAQTTTLASYRGGVTFIDDPGGSGSMSNPTTITFNGRGLCTVPNPVYITNADNLNIYRIQVSGAGGISTSVWNSTNSQWVRY
jgi:prepilin-type N-terminal cleavage/methylation domain-containing protein